MSGDVQTNSMVKRCVSVCVGVVVHASVGLHVKGRQGYMRVQAGPKG